MNWHLPRKYRDHLPDRDDLRDYVDTDRLAGYLPSRSGLPSLGLFDRRRKNTEATLAIGVGAAALIGLCAGAWLVSRDKALEKKDMEKFLKGRSDFGHGGKKKA